MHEATFAQSILDLSLRALPPEIHKIIRLNVVTGALSRLEEHCLTLVFSELAKGTAAEGAQLSLVVEPAKLTCQECGFTKDFFGNESIDIYCAKCQGRTVLSGGNSLYLESMEVDG